MKARVSKCTLQRSKQCKSALWRHTQSKCTNKNLHTLTHMVQMYWHMQEVNLHFYWLECRSVSVYHVLELISYMTVPWILLLHPHYGCIMPSEAASWGRLKKTDTAVACHKRRRVYRQKEKKETQKCRNKGKEIKTERWKKESGTEREAGREGWLEIGVSKRWCMEERVMRVSWLLSWLQ